VFDHTSRYYALETAVFTGAEGREVRYKRRRFLPAAETAVIIAEHTVTQGERLDNIAARYLGDPEQYWRLCDDNGAMRPEELTAEVGRRLRVTMPQAPETG
jgi:hypothetical protein